MLNLKLVATDLDRTLLKTDKSISQFTKDTFQALHDKGIKFAYITARTSRKVGDFLSGLPVDAIAYNNGSRVCCGDSVILENQIPYASGRNILINLNNNFPGVNISAVINNQNFYNFDSSRIDNIHVFRTDYSDIPNSPVDRIIIHTNNINDVMRYITPDVHICTADSSSCVITGRYAQKQIALKSIADYFNIDLINVISFGDDNNDIEMLKVSGTGVAVDNANDEVKSVADFITSSNDDDGVARFLAEYL